MGKGGTSSIRRTLILTLLILELPGLNDLLILGIPVFSSSFFFLKITFFLWVIGLDKSFRGSSPLLSFLNVSWTFLTSLSWGERLRSLGGRAGLSTDFFTLACLLPVELETEEKEEEELDVTLTTV